MNNIPAISQTHIENRIFIHRPFWSISLRCFTQRFRQKMVCFL